MSLQRTYYPARACSGGPTVGAKALMAWWLGAYGHLGAKNLGIFNCRAIAGSQTLSLHGEGRADDLGVPVGNSWAAAVFEAMRLQSKELGIQLIIYNRRVWSARQPDAGWRHYDGEDPHTNHGHVELTPDAARTLTVAAINRSLSASASEDIVTQLPTLKKGATGEYVERLQALLNVADGATVALKPDGVFGDNTDAAVRRFQAAYNVRASVDNGVGDGEVGKYTWAALLGVSLS